jgi:pimeloyl-ACP methyl ester carboxylesterase
MTPKHARISDRIVRYHESGDGRTLVLIHAFPLSADQWLPQLRHAPPGWRLIAPDLRGFRGIGSEAPADGGASSPTMATHVADVLALMDHLEVGSAVVAGLSMGGYVALAFAKLAAARLDGLVLADTKATADDETGRAARDKMIALVGESGPEAVADLLLPKLLGETTQGVQPDLAERIKAAIVLNSSEGIASGVRAMKLREDATSWLPEIKCPTLVICGTEDVLTPREHSEAMARAIPGAELVLLSGVGHLSNLEAPMAFTDALAMFLDRKRGRVSLTRPA